MASHEDVQAVNIYGPQRQTLRRAERRSGKGGEKIWQPSASREQWHDGQWQQSSGDERGPPLRASGAGLRRLRAWIWRTARRLTLGLWKVALADKPSAGSRRQVSHSLLVLMRGLLFTNGPVRSAHLARRSPEASCRSFARFVPTFFSSRTFPDWTVISFLSDCPLQLAQARWFMAQRSQVIGAGMLGKRASTVLCTRVVAKVEGEAAVRQRTPYLVSH